MKRNKNKKGFTIVELVIVIGVIGILSAILIPTFVSLTSKANDAALKSNLANAYSMYAADAADRKSDKDESKTIEFRSQVNVVLVKDAKYYTYKVHGTDAEPSWGEDGMASLAAKYKLVVDEDSDASTFNTFVVYYDSTSN